MAERRRINFVGEPRELIPVNQNPQPIRTMVDYMRDLHRRMNHPINRDNHNTIISYQNNHHRTVLVNHPLSRNPRGRPGQTGTPATSRSHSLNR